MMLNGEYGQFCSRCGRWLGEREAVLISASSRQNPHAGRIAWARDGICRDCATAEVRKNAPEAGRRRANHDS